MSRKFLKWNVAETPEELQPILKVLAQYYPIQATNSPGNVRFIRGDSPAEVCVSPHHIKYGSLRGAGRGIGLFLAGCYETNTCSFDTTGIMLDCSRNAVPKVEWLKSWLARLFLYGFNKIMLYTEDTYACEPWFGYCRGAYTQRELMAVDDFAAELHMELIPCIQTLGHLGQLLKLPPYKSLADTEQNLLPREPQTYELIQKMLLFCRATFRSNQIHLGFDEVFQLGQGRYCKLNQPEHATTLFNEHLQRVQNLCKQLNYKPLIWSDMCFRTRNPQGQYYYYTAKLEQPVIPVKLPPGLKLVYWDYYHWQTKTYLNMINLHRQLNIEPVIASAVWTFKRLWADVEQSEKCIFAAVDAGRKAQVKDFYLTLWGDDGAYCDFDSAETVFLTAMDKIWQTQHNNSQCQKIYRAISAGNFSAATIASKMQVAQPEEFVAGLSAAAMLWDDPLLGIVYRNQLRNAPWTIEAMYNQVGDILQNLKGLKSTGGGDLAYARSVAQVLKYKIELRRGLEILYKNHDLSDHKKLLDLAEKKLPQAIARLQKNFRRQWLQRNKSFGLEVIQIRLAGVAERCRETARRLKNPAPWQVLPELENPDLSGSYNPSSYRRIATGSMFI